MATQIPFRQVADGGTVGDDIEVIRTNLALLVGQMESLNCRLVLGPQKHPLPCAKTTLTLNQARLCDIHSAIASLSKGLRRSDAS